MNRIENEHAHLVYRLAKPGEAIRRELTDEQAHVLHMAVGIAGEAGELLDAVKKWAVYQKPLDRKNVVEELGDLEFYLRGLRDALEISREDTLFENIVKLNLRYGETYSNAAAQARVDKERIELV